MSYCLLRKAREEAVALGLRVHLVTYNGGHTTWVLFLKEGERPEQFSMKSRMKRIRAILQGTHDTYCTCH